MEHKIPLDPDGRAYDSDYDDKRDDGTHEIAPDVAYQRLMIVNVILYGARDAGDRNWVLIDSGIPGMAERIVDAAKERFGELARPAAIIQTHGHFDHIGTLEELSERWDVPIYAHTLELPYLNGGAAYPPPDPGVGGGIMSLLSPFFPRGPVDVSRRLHPLPLDGSVPGMPGWRWLHTPGHTPGHISLWRESDRLVIAGDAFITTSQESAYAVATQRPELHGPPMYYTQNWKQSRESVKLLAGLNPEIAVTGHGPAMRGIEMLGALRMLAHDFDRIAVPEDGKYVEHPTTAESGTAYDPPDG
jgi:glyoxylase-like metal-dependent hydrolase (beta-lactamase superfamily II)